jgi:hypothetical protein
MLPTVNVGRVGEYAAVHVAVLLQQTADQDDRRAALAAAERELARTSTASTAAAIETGTVHPEDLAGRLGQLKVRPQQLRARRDELATQPAAVPSAPPPATLRPVADHIADIVGSGSGSQRKALIGALTARSRSPDPAGSFCVPCPTGTEAMADDSRGARREGGARYRDGPWLVTQDMSANEENDRCAPPRSRNPWTHMSGIFPIDPQADLASDTAHPGEFYVLNFVGDDPRLFAGVWSADAQETLIESYPVDEVYVVLAGLSR